MGRLTHPTRWDRWNAYLLMVFVVMAVAGYSGACALWWTHPDEMHPRAVGDP